MISLSRIGCKISNTEKELLSTSTNCYGCGKLFTSTEPAKLGWSIFPICQRCIDRQNSIDIGFFSILLVVVFFVLVFGRLFR